MEDVIQEFVERDAVYADLLRKRTKYDGKELEDMTLINLLQRRLEFKDCQKHGWVLEGFPKTRSQAILMAKKQIVPTNVIFIDVPTDEVYRRTEPDKNTVFDCDRTVLKARISNFKAHFPDTLFYYRVQYNNVSSIDGTKSRWFMQDVAIDGLRNNLKARMEFARDYFFGQSEGRPCIMENLNCERGIFKQTLSQFGYFCPVSWKVHKTFISCCHRPELSVLYQNFFYYFASKAER